MRSGPGGLWPWCAAKVCPATAEQGCLGFINENCHNPAAHSFVACCMIQCGRSANDGLVALECGGATTATAVIIIAFLLVLLVVGAYILALAPFRRMKVVTSWMIIFGSLVYTTGTGVFVTNATSPFAVLPTVPALGAMNVAVFSYFYSGFRYGVGVGYESGPLFVFLVTAFTTCKVLLGQSPDPGGDESPVRTARNLALAMLVFTFLWNVHSFSYRLYGYLVEWRLGHGLLDDGRKQNPRFHLGAAQGHPTWRTPMGQSTSVIMTALAWSLVRAVETDLAVRECRPDWVLRAMEYGAPVLISVTILWNILSGIRCRKVGGQIVRIDHPNTPFWGRRMLRKLLKAFLSDSVLRRVHLGEHSREQNREAEYPGLQSYKDAVESFKSVASIKHRIKEYVIAVAMQRMARNSLFAEEEVPDSRLEWSDCVIGFIAWLFALIGLVISTPGFFGMMLVAESLGRFFEAVCCDSCRFLVETTVTEADRISAAKVVEECYVGKDLGETEPQSDSDAKQVFDVALNSGPKEQRSINLNTLLDAAGHCEMFNLLSEPGMSQRR